MRLSDDRITEMQHALEQRMMIGSVESGSALPGDTNGVATILTADAEFPEMIIDVSNQLYAAHWVETFGTIEYAYRPSYQETPHQFTVQVGDFRSASAPTPTPGQVES